MASVIKDISALLPNAQIACKAFMTECEKLGLKVRITETYRSQERQNELYAQGRTKSGKKVTWTLNSRHTSRRAWDICQNIKGREYDTSTGFFERCGQVAERLGIIWGGNWNTPDRPHFEVSANWCLPDDYISEEDMEELKKLDARVSKLENKMIYNYIDKNMPEWAKPTIQKLVDKGYLQGNENGLNLTDELLRMLVINDRAGIYD